ncbi:hypothetical protein B0H10DRAFT_2226678 [Mycena sp. CBHHK59/15]|nr:hypothetical protein B0H10DRAFT_2226678 [Mycena sp. CBHHK59/15]
MPSLFNALVLLGLAGISNALAAPTVTVRELTIPIDCNLDVAHTYEMCSTLTLPRSVSETPSRERVPSSMTNGERLARHLPLKPPTRRSSGRRAVPSSSTATPMKRGYIQVLSVDANGNPAGVLGYVSKNTYIKAQYVLQPSLDGALLVGQSGDHDLLTLNSDTPSPAFLGLAQGREDTSSVLAKGSFNYLSLASTEQTPPNATPQAVGSSYNTVYGGSRTAESAVFTLDSTTNALVVRWINPNGSAAPTIPFTQGSAIYFSGDPDAFRQKFSAPVQSIAFKFVPA